jgi:ABC-type multidrug transport system ATPase subunit
MLDFDRVTARGLVKMYGPTRALAGVDLTLEAGKVTVVEGPNGSGKSTLVAILAMLARPTRGEVKYGAVEARRGGAALRARIGVLGHAAMVYPDLSARENLLFFAKLHDVANAEARITALAERFEIAPAFLDRPARTWSRGQLQRVALARALLHAPRLLLLDEPSTGLDTATTERLVTAVAEEKKNGTILALITHDAALADRIADVRVRLERGKVVTS